MIAVIETGGKQYTVSQGQKLLVEKLSGSPGEHVRFSKVLLLKSHKGDIHVGSPVIEGAAVIAEFVRQTRGDKVIVFKKKRRHNYRRKKGHRQDLSLLHVHHIALPGEAIPASFEPIEQPNFSKKVVIEEKPVTASDASTDALQTESPEPPVKKARVSKKAASPKKPAAE